MTSNTKTNNTGFATQILIEALYKEFTAEQAGRMAEAVVETSTFAGAVVEQGAAVTVEQALSYFKNELPTPYPVWITNGNLQR